MLELMQKSGFLRIFAEQSVHVAIILILRLQHIFIIQSRASDQ